MPRPAFEGDLLVAGPPEQVWARLWDLDRHTSAIPLTTVAADLATSGERDAAAAPSPSGLRQDARFTARTALGPVGFDDDMVVRAWDPPRRAVIDKVGRVLTGRIEVHLRPAGPDTQLRWAQTFGAGLGTLRVPGAVAGLAARPVRAAYRQALVRITRP